MFPLKIRRMEHVTKDLKIVRDEGRTGIVDVGFEQVFALTFHIEHTTLHSHCLLKHIFALTLHTETHLCTHIAH
jgi:hypothetical protein